MTSEVSKNGNTFVKGLMTFLEQYVSMGGSSNFPSGDQHAHMPRTNEKKTQINRFLLFAFIDIPRYTILKYMSHISQNPVANGINL